jgi:hypothetical protein
VVELYPFGRSAFPVRDRPGAEGHCRRQAGRPAGSSAACGTSWSRSDGRGARGPVVACSTAISTRCWCTPTRSWCA